jgi:muramoyltetrapeptide carboxypeptidase
VLAPAGCVDEASLNAGIEAIRKRGFKVQLSDGVRASRGYLAGDAEQRANDLRELFSREDIEAIFCARGGFGSIQLLPHLDKPTFQSHPKIFVGYSDISILLNWLTQECGLATFHGPMVAMDMAQGLKERSEEYFWKTLSGESRAWQIEVGEVIRAGAAQAPMMGGCLSVLVTTLGTPYEIDTSGKLLFLEDIGEKPYRIERMLTHLKMAGKLDGPAGVVFGDFTQCEGEGSRGVREILFELFRDAPYPVVMGLAAGHGEENLILPFGVKMALEGTAGTLSLLESPVA